jgi:hypothetical protein
LTPSFLFFFFEYSEWHLEADEQPVRMEGQFFESLGYTHEDKLEQQGRKDHGYLFSFIYSDRPRNHDKPVRQAIFFKKFKIFDLYSFFLMLYSSLTLVMEG